jgi:hypothetical protein
MILNIGMIKKTNEYKLLNESLMNKKNAELYKACNNKQMMVYQV